mgnify:CR=1 FL=1
MFDYKKYLAEGGIESKLEIRGSVLTKEDRKAIASMVIEESYQGITLAEAKTNESLKENIAENIKFYNAVKQMMLEEAKKQQRPLHEGALKDVLGLLGGIKDAWTATAVGKDVTKWIRSRMSKFASATEKVASKVLPTKAVEAGKSAKEVASILADKFEKALTWLVKTFSYQGIAKLFAMIRYKKLKPSKEQIKCMVPAAKKTVSAIYAALVIAFIAKIGLFAAPVIAAGGLPALQAATLGVVAKAGLWGGAKVVATKAFSTYSAMKKAQDAAKYAKQAKEMTSGAVDSALEDFSSAWDTCAL